MPLNADLVFLFCVTVDLDYVSDAKLCQHVANLTHTWSITHFSIPCAVQMFNTVLFNRNSVEEHHSFKQLTKVSRRDSR